MRFIDSRLTRHVYHPSRSTILTTECGLWLNSDSYDHEKIPYRKQLPLCGNCKRLIQKRLKEAL
jgi:hypothetical protein